MLQRALALDPEYGEAHNVIAYIYALKEHYLKAQEWIDRRLAEASSPADQISCHRWKALYSFWLGSVDLCLSHLQKAAEIAAAGI